MAQLSLEALRRASLAVLRERAAAERSLQDMDPESDEAHDLGDEVVQMMKVEGELYDAYTELQEGSAVMFPAWDELVAAAEAG
jgi:hypothetical protein